MEIIGHGYGYEARFGSWLRLQKKVYGDEARIEAGSSKLEARVSSIHMRASIRASTTTNVILNFTIRASLPLPSNETYFLFKFGVNGTGKDLYQTG
jgi:hypothetical protein